MKKALIVDDNEQNLYLLQTMLKGQGYDVLTAANGVEALEQARRVPPDIVISDILMPVMDGFILCREWRKDERLQQIPFVFYTATYTDPRDEELALSLGAARFVVKPQDPGAFTALVRQVINEYEASPPVAPAQPASIATDYYKLYSEALVRKLEDKMLKLEQLNRSLGQEITDRHRAEDTLRQSEKKYRMIAENTNDLIWILDLESKRVTYASPSVKKITGYTVEEHLNRPLENILTPQSLKMMMEVLSEGFKRDANREGDEDITDRIEWQEFHKDGHLIWVEAETNFIRDDQGKPIGVIGVSRDISERKHAEEEKEKLAARLIQAQKMESVGRLAGGVAHDFNNMLGVILGHAEMAMDKVNSIHPIHADLEEIYKAAQRSADLTRQLLAFARKQTVAPKVLDLNENLEAMLKMLRQLIGEDIDLVWHPRTNLWPVKVDPSQLDQILANLCVNARDAIPGVGKVTIETGNVTFDEAYCADHAGFVPGEFVILAVSDDGCGMDKETLNQLFEPFFTTKEVGKGTGLGLATVYGSVKQNNGFINVYSEPGKGTTFRIYLPRHAAKEEQMQKEGPAAPAARGHDTILLVEDEPSILRMTTIMLERLGYVVLAASTPGEAIRLAREHGGEIYLLMTDVVMPEMNGRDLAKNLLSLYPNLKRLFMSGYTADVIAHHGVLDEGVHFIQKPFSMQEIAAKVREALDEVDNG